MKTFIHWTVRLCALLLAFAVHAQRPAGPLDWFEGSWEINYRDAQLGEVRGQAAVRVEGDGNVLISYTVTDPRDGATHELTAFHIRHSAGVITMELSPGGPVASLDAEGRPLPATPAGNTVTAPGGARLRATLGDKEAEAGVVPISSRLSTRLRLTREGDRLSGEWEVTRDGNMGFAGARSGTRSTVTRTLPAPIGEVREEVVRGPETWQSARMVVKKAQRVGWKDAAAAGDITGIADVALIGKNLPEPRRREVRFSDPYLVPDNADLTGNLPVSIAKRAVPGPKTFTLKDKENTQEAPGVWVFDWPGIPAKQIHHARRIADGDFEPTSTIYFGEHFFVEVEIDRPVPGDLRLYAIETDAAEPVFFHVKRDPSRRSKFRAGPFVLLAPNEPYEGSAVQAPALQLNQSTATTPDEARPFIVRATRGTRIRTAPATTQLGEPLAAAFAEAKEDHSEDGPFQRALKMAEDFRKRYPDADRYNISKFTPLSGSRRTLITVQDHAALILLHGELLRNMDNLRRQHTRQLSTNERRALAASLMEASRTRADLPLFYYDVPSHDGKSTMRLNAAVYPNNLREAFGNDTAKRDEYLDRVIAEAGRKMSEHAVKGAARISQTDISRPETLLPSIKAGYSSAAASIMHRLVRRSRPANGEPATPRWVPDQVGRAAVRGVPDLLGAIAADEELADFQWGALQIMALPAGIYTGILGAAGTFTRGALAVATAGDLLMGAGAANNLFRLDAAMDMRDAGWDVAPVAGYDAYRGARDEVFARGVTAAVDIPLTLLGAASTAAQLAKAGVRPSAQAARAAVTSALENGMDSLSDNARAQFALVFDSAARKAASGAVDSLTDIERAALRANFPDGIPSNVARDLKIAPSNPDFVIRVGEDTLAGAAGKLPPAPEIPVAPRVAPEASSNPAIRRMFEENLNNSRLGVPEAQGRLAQIERAAAEWEQLPPQARGVAAEALETLNRLRRENPDLAKLSEAEALSYFNFHSRRQIGANDVYRPVSPEELAMEFLRWKGRNVSAPALARAANISEANAEGALLAADRRIPYDPNFSSGSSRPPADPKASTIGPAPVRQPVELPPPTPREAEIAAHLERFGMEPTKAQVAAAVPGARPGDARVGAAHAAFSHGVPAKRVQDALGLKPQELRSMLDDYLRRFDSAGDAERARLLNRYFGEEGTVIEPRKLLGPSDTEARFPPGLAPPAAKPDAARADVLSSLEKMGIPRAQAEKFTPPSSTGGSIDSRAAAAELAQSLDVPAPRAARALGISETEYAGLLDRAAGRAQPNLTPSQRAASVAGDLRSDGVTQPFSRVLEARQNQVDAALRDVGVPRGDPAFTRSGLDPESAIVGQALENGVPARDIASRRGLTPQEVESLADDFLRDGRNISDAAERARHRTELISGNPVEPGPNASTVRLSPRVLAMQDEIATALERVGVDRLAAADRAANLVNVGRRDAHEAIIGGAWQSRVPPARLREQFGYSDSQIARGLDAFLANNIGMREPAARANFIARNYFGQHGQQFDAAAVAGMISGTPPPAQPLRAMANPPRRLMAPPPPPRPLPGVPAAEALDERFGPAILPRYHRDGELTTGGAWRANTGATEIKPGTPARLNPDLRYNWLVDNRGRVIVGPEQYVIENGRAVLDGENFPVRLGHPAMINGGQARIAGELRYVEGQGWMMDTISGRYSMGREELTPQHLENAASILREAGLNVHPHFSR